MRSRLYLALLTLLLISSSATAQTYSRSGAYVGLNGVAGFASVEGLDDDLLDTSIGVAGRLGYRFSSRLAAEAQVEYTGDFIDCCGADLTATLLTFNGKFYVLQDQLQPYLLAGMGGAFGDISGPGVSVDDSAFVVRFGGGLDFYVTNNFGLELEVAYNVGTGDLDDFNYTGIGWGAFYRF